jgi:hypothetical protein
MIHRLAVVLLALALLAAPAGAFAQSAGDDQYTDPFGPSEEAQQEGGGSNGSEGAQTPAPAPAPDPAPAPAPAEGSVTQQPETEPDTQAVDPGPTLPYSGFPAGIAAGAGALLLAAGAALRRRL